MRLISLLGATLLCLVSFAFAACVNNADSTQQTPGVDQSAPVDEQSYSPASPATLPPVTVRADGSVDLDRLCADLSGVSYKLNGSSIDPVEYCRQPIAKNEVQVCFDKSYYTYTFSDLPPNDETTPSFFGYGISFCLIDGNTYNSFPSRAITEQTDSAYVLMNTLKQDFVVCDKQPDLVPWLCIYLQNGTDTDNLFVYASGSVYHTTAAAKLTFDEDAHIDYDYMSKAPLEGETMAALAAMAYHYAQYETKDVNPVLFKFSSVFMDFDPLYEDYMAVMIEYNGESVHLTGRENLIALSKIFDEGVGAESVDETGEKLCPSYYAFDYSCACGISDNTSSAMKFTLYPKAESPDYYLSWNVFYLTDDGRILCRPMNNRTIFAYDGANDPYILSIGFFGNTEMLSNGTFSKEKLVDLINNCR